MSPVLRVGISTCPNDTYLFHGLLSGAVRVPGLELAIELGDIEELNRALLAGRLDVVKASYALALGATRDWLVLPVGSALGRGVGPVVLAARPGSEAEPGAVPRVLLPGEHTTAALLHRIFHPEQIRREQCVFSEIIPRLRRGEAELGVCIHEARFTWASQGLHWVEDLGERYERASGSALPLGGLFAKRSLPLQALRAFTGGLRRSLALARERPRETVASMSRYAQEHSEAVLWKHVELYVDERTEELGGEGQAAVRTLARLAREAGCLAGDAPEPAFLASEGDAALSPAGPRPLYHCLREEEAAGLWAGGTEHHHPPSLRSEGFVHLSYAEQLPGTLELHYSDCERVTVLALDPTRVGGALRVEASRGHRRFPHLYRPLERADVVGVERWERAPGGYRPLPPSYPTAAGARGADQAP